MERKSATLFKNCPYEVGSQKTGFIEMDVPVQTKSAPPRVTFADESSRGALNKVVLPNFLLRPPFGMPRFKDVVTLKRLGNTPQARMAKQTIIDEIVSIPWTIKSRSQEDEVDDATQIKIDEITNFFLNPNTRGDSWEWLTRAVLEDALNYDSGILVKEFDEQMRMVEIVAADGRTFLKNPDIHGKFTERADIIPFGGIGMDQTTISGLFGTRDTALQFNTPVGLTIEQAKVKAAYFQFGFISTSRPVAFGRKEIVWLEKNPQTDQIYGKSPIESIMEVLQNLLYSIEYHLDYFEDNNVPKGFINLAGAEEDEMNSFRDKWNELQLKTNAQGLLKKNFHRIPITNTENAGFVPIQFSAQEMQLIEEQMWFSKLVWATFGVTPSELGFTENSNLATEINQSRVFKRKAIIPWLKILEHKINSDIISEWGFGDDIVFEYDTFDIEDEKSKWDLYDLQIRTGAITKNEVRRREGLEEIEELDVQEVTDADLIDPNNPKDPDPKESIERAEDKGLDLDKIESMIEKLFKAREKEIIHAVRMESKGDRLTQIKSFKGLIESIGRVLNLDNLKTLINKATEGLYLKGIMGVEKFVKNEGIVTNSVFANQNQVKFLAELTFGNIKGMETEIANKLRQQLRMGIVNGEGVTKLVERVKSVFDVGETRLKAIARTEASRIESMGALKAAQDIQADGINIKKWLLWVNDSRTSELTKALHAKYGSPEKAIPVNDDFEINFQGKAIKQPAPPFHVNERDTLMTFIVEDQNDS